MNDPADFDKLVRNCHAVTVGDMDWTELLRQISSFVGGDKGLMMNAVGGAPYSAFATAGFDMSVTEKYQHGFNARDPRKAVSMRLKQGEVSTGQTFLPNSEIKTTEYFREITVPADVFDSVHAVILDDQVHGRRAISVQRPFGDEFFGPPEVARMRAVLPYLSDAMRYSLDAIPSSPDVKTVSCLVDRTFRVRVLKGCESVLRHKDSPIRLSYRAGHLSISGQTKQSHTSLLRLWDAAALGKTLQFVIEMADGASLTVTVCPSPRALDWIVSDAPQIFMTFAWRQQKTRPALAVYADIYGLTKAEGRVLGVLAKGYRGEAAADQIGIGKETLRWHVKNMLAKTGESRREDLIRAATQLDLTSVFRPDM